MSPRPSSSSGSSFLPPADLRGPLLAGAVVTVAAWSFVSFVPVFHNWLYGDVRFYENWGNWIANHRVPYRDFSIEYPPGALATFAAPPYLRKLFDYHGRYYFWFRIEILVFALLTVAAMGWALLHLRASRRRSYTALCAAAVCPALLGPIALARYDYWPALLAAAAVGALVARREVLACALAGAGAAAKVFPILFLPFALIELWRRGGARAVAVGVAAAAAVIGASVVPFAVVAPHGLWWALHRQVARPLQVESLGAVILAAAHQLADVHLHVAKSAGSDNLVGAAPDALATASGIATVLALLAVYAWYLRSRRSVEELVVGCVAVVVAYIAFSKVFSPQYLVWLFPLVPLVGGRRGLRASALFLLVVGVTQVWEPYRYGPYIHTFAPWLTWLVTVRDLLFVCLLGVVLWSPRSERHAERLDPARAAVG